MINDNDKKVLKMIAQKGLEVKKKYTVDVGIKVISTCFIKVTKV